jgi:hypothetical protein
MFIEFCLRLIEDMEIHKVSMDFYCDLEFYYF